MKNLLKISLLFIIIISCSKNSIDDKFSQDIKPLTKSGNFSTYNVSIEEATFLSRIQNYSNKNRKNDIKNIIPVIEEGDTLIYITNFNDNSGWMIISGDKRTQSIIAYFEKNNFDIEKMPLTVNAWYTDVKNTIKKIKQSNVDNPKYTHFWKEIERSIRLKKQGDIATKGDNDDLWLQLVYTVVETNDIEYNIPHLTQTRWHQEYPWNTCVPYTDISFQYRCATGCVAVSGAQMAYYLHYNLGKPIYTYSNGSFYGIPSNYTSQFSNYNSASWDTMSLTDNDSGNKASVAALMGYIGLKVNMNWGVTSGAFTADLSSYFSEQGVNTSFSNFSTSIVSNSLINQMPVITRAEDQSDAHSWIIDGLYVKRDKYTYYYQWMPRWTYPPVEPVEPDWNNLDQYVISEPVYSNYYTYYRMNWGWGEYGFQNYDGNYCYGEDWYLGSYNLITDRKILYNFN